MNDSTVAYFKYSKQVKGKRIENTACKHSTKESQSSYVNIRLSTLKNKENDQGQHKTVYNGTRVNSPKRHNNLKCYAPNVKAAKYMKQKLREMKGEQRNPQQGWGLRYPFVRN